jgi:plasmid stabilization system protein ParE
MENEITRQQVVVSELFQENRKCIYQYGLYTFGYFQAERYNRQIENALLSISQYPTIYPECRHLSTKKRLYRNAILDAHLIIYRITTARIEVLDIVHSASSIHKIQQTRSLRIIK